jgi:hypothetical protein
MASALRCFVDGTAYQPGMKGWHARVQGLGPGVRGDGPLTVTLICPQDFAKLPPSQRMAWHEYTGNTEGPTREKRPGRLGENT